MNVPPEAQQAGSGPPPKGWRRFTTFVAFDGDAIEEIDIDAVDLASAEAEARWLLQRDYQPGGEIVATEERTGLYM